MLFAFISQTKEPTSRSVPLIAPRTRQKSVCTILMAEHQSNRGDDVHSTLPWIIVDAVQRRVDDEAGQWIKKKQNTKNVNPIKHAHTCEW